MEGLEGFGGFGGFGRFWQFGAFAGGQTAALKAHRKPLLWPWPLGCLLGKWPWPWGACWTRCLEGLDGFGERPEGLEGFGGFGGLEGFGGCLECLEGFGAFGVFAGWQTAALKANRKPLLWPWPWVPD